jgi:hypothetical protein
MVDELGNGKKVNFNIIYVFFEKSLDLDHKNGLSSTFFWYSVVCIYHKLAKKNC